MINQFIFIGLLVITWTHMVRTDTADVSVESEESAESTEETNVSARSPASLMSTSQQLSQLEMLNKTKYNNMKNQTNNKIKKPIVQQLQPFGPYFYPAIIPPYFFRRTNPYQPAYYHPYMMPFMSPLYPTKMSAMSSLYPTNSPTARDDMLTGKQSFPVDDELSEEEALKELEAIKREIAEDAAAQRHLDRLVLPSISVNRDESSVTVSLKSFAALLRSLSSRVTVTLATRTILVPDVSIRN